MTSNAEPVTLANCESEPIHIPGAIQPHGALIATRSADLKITQVSANLAEFFGCPAEDALGKAVADLLDSESAERIQQIASAPRLREMNPFRLASKQLVELHGGQVSAESEGRGAGATFRVLLPISPFVSERVTPVDAPVLTPPRARLEGIEVLVVEDDDDSRELIVSILQQAHAVTHAVGDAITALGMLSKRSFDAIVSDVGLPEMTGIDFMRALRARPSDQAKRTPAIALTAYTRASDRVAVMEAGFQAHVPKPVDPTELVATVSSLVGR